MSLVSKHIYNLFNGVSQQAPELRSPSQASIQENALSSPTDGLKKRPGTQHIARLSTGGQSALVHFIERDAREKYAVVAESGNIRVFDALTGAERLVNAPAGLNYLVTGDPQRDLRLISVADHTFVVNTQRDVQMAVELADAQDSLKALISFPVPVAQTPPDTGGATTAPNTPPQAPEYWTNYPAPTPGNPGTPGSSPARPEDGSVDDMLAKYSDTLTDEEVDALYGKPPGTRAKEDETGGTAPNEPAPEETPEAPPEPVYEVPEDPLAPVPEAQQDPMPASKGAKDGDIIIFEPAPVEFVVYGDVVHEQQHVLFSSLFLPGNVYVFNTFAHLYSVLHAHMVSQGMIGEGAPMDGVASMINGRGYPALTWRGAPGGLALPGAVVHSFQWGKLDEAPGRLVRNALVANLVLDMPLVRTNIWGVSTYAAFSFAVQVRVKGMQGNVLDAFTWQGLVVGRPEDNYMYGRALFDLETGGYTKTFDGWAFAPDQWEGATPLTQAPMSGLALSAYGDTAEDDGYVQVATGNQRAYFVPPMVWRHIPQAEFHPDMVPATGMAFVYSTSGEHWLDSDGLAKRSFTTNYDHNSQTDAPNWSHGVVGQSINWRSVWQRYPYAFTWPYYD